MATNSDIWDDGNAGIKEILQKQQNVDHYESGKWGKEGSEMIIFISIFFIS